MEFEDPKPGTSGKDIANNVPDLVSTWQGQFNIEGVRIGGVMALEMSQNLDFNTMYVCTNTLMCN